jgi:hypothetical protein
MSAHVGGQIVGFPNQAFELGLLGAVAVALPSLGERLLNVHPAQARISPPGCVLPPPPPPPPLHFASVSLSVSVCALVSG